MNGMFSALGVLNVEHHTITTKNFITTLKDFLSIPNSKLIRGPSESLLQNTRYAFVELNGIGVVEVLSPLGDGSPIFEHLNSVSASFLCYRVSDLDFAIDIAEKKFGSKLLPIPSDEVIFDGRRAAFLTHSEHGIFKLLEALPRNLCADNERQRQPIENEANAEVQRLLGIYCSVVDRNARKLKFDQISMQNCSEWDSFKHLMLIMEVEKVFEIKIPASMISELTSLDKIEKHLRNMV